MPSSPAPASLGPEVTGPATTAINSVTIPLIAAPPLTGKAAIDALKGKLTDKATETFFGPLLQIAEVGQIDATSPLAMGDGDGSTARMVVMGLQAGKMNIDQAGLDMLATLLHDEAVCERTFVGLKAFQEKKERQALIATLAEHLSYQESEIPLIFIGDMAHDRWSCNKDIDRKIREDLHKNGAIFIRGNHDVYAHMAAQPVEHVKKFGQGDVPLFLQQPSAQCGAFALDSADADTWETHEKLFVNAYYDEAANRLYIHNGLCVSQDPTRLETALDEVKFRDSVPETQDLETQDAEVAELLTGFVDLGAVDLGTTEITAFFDIGTDAFAELPTKAPVELPKKELVLEGAPFVKTPKDFAYWMNQQKIIDERQQQGMFTGFRPTDAKILEAAQHLDKKLSVVHGHDSDANLANPDGVLNINARKGNGRDFATIAVRIGKTNVQVS